jgi:dihydropteroate synthase
MGVLNLTPDSFSGDGLSWDTEAALAQAKRFTAQGADIIDIGGESTRPGGQTVSAAEEIKRVIPAIERLADELSVPISIDTYKASVARRAVAAGARMINDVWGLRQDAALARVAAEAGLPLVLTSNQRDEPAADIISGIVSDLERAIRQAVAAGVPRECIIIDPGIGFGKSLEQNLEILRRLAELKQLGRPILLGTSRKSLIGLVLDLPVEERLLGTAATVAIGIANGADIVRVHDVKEMREVSRMSDAIVRGIK